MIRRITRKMRRDSKKNVNPLEELLIIIKQYFPKLTDWIDNLTDSRNQSYVTYDLKICLLGNLSVIFSSWIIPNLLSLLKLWSSTVE